MARPGEDDDAETTAGAPGPETSHAAGSAPASKASRKAKKPAKPPKPPKAKKEPRAPRSSRRPLPAVLLPPHDYVARTQHGPINLLFLAPWMLVYVLCRWGAGPTIETQAAKSLETALRLLGRRPLLVLTICTCLAVCAVLLARIRKAKADAAVFPWMLVEGVGYGLLLPFVADAMRFAMPVGRWVGLFRGAAEAKMRGLGIAVGAGIFEELVFRGLLCFALFRAVRTILGADRFSAGAIAVVGSAFVFAAYHHWGAGGEPWNPENFAFRFHAGVLLGVVFLTRGLGIAAFAHGFYDAMVLLG